MRLLNIKQLDLLVIWRVYNFKKKHCKNEKNILDE